MTHSPTRNLARLMGLNGFGVLLFAGLATVFSVPFFFSWPGFLAGLAVSFSALAEVRGFYLLRRSEYKGIHWAAASQVGVFFSLVSYASFQLFSGSGDLVTSLPTEARRFVIELYQIDDVILAQLLQLAARMVYISLILASLVYQGGLYFYYRLKWRQLSRAGVATSRRSFSWDNS